jgi:hypothetical protein
MLEEKAVTAGLFVHMLEEKAVTAGFFVRIIFFDVLILKINFKK